MRRLGRFFMRFLALIGLATLVTTGLALWGLAHLHDAVEPPLPKRAVLALDLEARFKESGSPDPFARFSGEKAYELGQVVEAIDRAAKDDRVVALFATLGDSGMGMGRAQEVRDAVARFRASGKPAVAFAETLGESGNGTLETYLASAFGQVWLQPSGDVGLTGFLAESPFVKGTFDMLGIEPQFVARHEFKSAIEIFQRKDYSEAHKQSMNALLDGWADQVVRGVAEGRRLPPEKVKALLGNGPFLANEALSAGLVDKLGYRDEALAAAAGEGAKPEEVDVGDYAERLPAPAGGTKVALIIGSGAIHRGDGGSPFGEDEGFAAERIADAFREAIDDADIKAILFRVDSPGGSYVASDTVWHEVRRARAAGKKVVVSMADVAASGGYFVAMAADSIVAQPGTITGSIGVFSGKMVLKDFWPKLGVTWDELHRGANAPMWSANQPFSPQAWDRLNALADRVYADFTAKAGQGRNLPPEKVDQVARGRIWTGADAQAMGMVDKLGGYDVAKAELRRLMGLAPDAALAMVTLPEPRSPLERLAKLMSGGGMSDPAARALVRLARIAEPLVARLEALDPQAQGVLRMPPVELAR